MALQLVRFLGLLFVALVFTFPVNRATVNWTRLPENWGSLRRRREYSHAASAGLNLIALISLIASVLSAVPVAA